MEIEESYNIVDVSEIQASKSSWFYFVFMFWCSQWISMQLHCECCETISRHLSERESLNGILSNDFPYIGEFEYLWFELKSFLSVIAYNLYSHRSVSGTISKLLQMALSEFFSFSPCCNRSHSHTPRPPRGWRQEIDPRDPSRWPAECQGPTCRKCVSYKFKKIFLDTYIPRCRMEVNTKEERHLNGMAGSKVKLSKEFPQLTWFHVLGWLVKSKIRNFQTYLISRSPATGGDWEAIWTCWAMQPLAGSACKADLLQGHHCCLPQHPHSG